MSRTDWGWEDANPLNRQSFAGGVAEAIFGLIVLFIDARRRAL